MNCKKVQDLLITDYKDKQIRASLKSKVEEHLVKCASCREFEKIANEKGSLSIDNITTVDPPASVWNNIKEAIDKQQSYEYTPSLTDRLRDFVHDNLFARRPAVALATVFTVLLAVVMFTAGPMHQQALVNDYLRDSTQFMADLNGPVNVELVQSDEEFGSVIEKSFF